MLALAIGPLIAMILGTAAATWGVGKAVSMVFEGTKQRIDARKRAEYRRELTRMAHILKQKAPKPAQGLDPSTIEILMGAIGAGGAGELGEPGAPETPSPDTASLPTGLGEESFPGAVGEAGPGLGSDLAGILGMTQGEVRTAARPPATGMLALLGGQA